MVGEDDTTYVLGCVLVLSICDVWITREMTFGELVVAVDGNNMTLLDEASVLAFAEEDFDVLAMPLVDVANEVMLLDVTLNVLSCVVMVEFSLAIKEVSDGVLTFCDDDIASVGRF